MCSLAICVSTLQKCIFTSTACFNSGCFVGVELYELFIFSYQMYDSILET